MKARLLAAKSISYTRDGGGVDAIRKMLAALGIADELKPRITEQTVAGHAAESAAGEFEITFAPLGEMAAVPGILVLGRFPPEFQFPLPVSSGSATKAANAAAAQALARFLISPASMKVILANGMSPLTTPRVAK